MRKIFADDRFQKEFLQKGYVITRIFSDEEVAYLLNEIHNLNPADDFEANVSNGITNTFYTTFMDPDLQFKRKVGDLVRSLGTSRINEILIDYKILMAGLIVKTPGEGDIPVHRDWSFTDNFKDTNLTFWCPLVDVNETNGTLHIVDDTHKLVQNVECPQTAPFFWEYAESLKQHSTPILLKAGEAIIYDLSILHWSPPNNASNPRPIAAYMCIPQESKPVFYYPDKNAPGERFEVFEMDTELYDLHDGIDFMNGNIKTRSIGFIENKNRTVSEKEFFEMIEKSHEIRHELYFPKEAEKNSETVSILKKIKNLFGFNSN